MQERRAYSDWLRYWENKGREGRNIDVISGYEGHLSELPEDSHRRLISSIVDKLDLNENDNLLDVGCGAGMITLPLEDYVSEVIGIDASVSMLRHIPEEAKTNVLASMADMMPFYDNVFDKVLCHSIFQYFPNKEYAEKALKEMYRICKSGGKIYVVDIPDAEKEGDYNLEKKTEYHNLTRIFYSKESFLNIFPSAQIFNNELEGYGNAQYRFNILLEKE